MLNTGLSVMVIETQRLLLRKLSVDDAGFILGLLNEPSFLQFIGDRGVRTREDAQRYILDGPVQSYVQHGFGLYLTALKDSNTPIGMCGLLKRDWLTDVDIGFAFMPQFWLRGYAFESTAAVMSDARDTLGIKRIVAVVSPDNQGSIRVLEKAGMKYERMIRQSAETQELKLFASQS